MNELQTRLDQYEALMGKELARIFLELWNELTWLHHKWQEYSVIFATTEQQLAVANEAAGGFFYVVEKTLREDVFLHLARLTDPSSQQNGKQNLSLRLFENLVPENQRPRVAELTKQVLDSTQFARDWRMRYLAHRDLDLMLKRAKPLMPASRIKIQKALAAMALLVNTIDVMYADTSTSFEPIAPLNGAEALLNVLRAGLAANATREEEDRLKWGLL